MAQVLRHVPVVSDPRALVGALTRDDAAVYQVSEAHAIVATVDFFTPIVDDAYTFGAIAAANAFSDVYAMGATPLFALNLVAWPRQTEMLDVLGDAMRGVTDVVTAAGAAVLGGHSIDDAEPKLGLVAIGIVHPEALITNAGAVPGDRLVLTKPLGTGILSTALKQERIDADGMEDAIQSMQALNDRAATAMRELGSAIHAATDVTGFGLLGHLHNVAAASAVAAQVAADRVPAFAGVTDLIAAGAVPGGTRRNLDAAADYVTWADDVDDVHRLLLTDAQTSGGLLIAVAPEHADALTARLRAADVLARDIGGIVHGTPGQIQVMHDG